MKKALNESVWRRGWDDTKAAWTNWSFAIISLVVSIVLFLIGFFVLEWYWGVGFAIIAVFGTWGYEMLTAPYKQRNEARKQVTILKTEDKYYLKGKFFYDFDEEGYVKHQGHIIDYLNEDIVIIQYFEWFMGEPSMTKTVWVKEIVDGGWALYSTDEEMRDAWECGHVKRR